MKNKAIFLDRDGVINIDKGYVHTIKDFIFYKDIFKALSLIPKEYKVIVVTNQAGIAKGLYTEKEFMKLTDWMLKKFKEKGIKIDKVYHCPHHTEGTITKYKKVCDCRKPNTGMLKKAQKDFNLDLKQCWLIGDHENDIIAGEKTKTKTILIDRKDKNITKNVKAKNLLKAISLILKS
ncbi:HAD family hydrolase [Candidatus Peregrinibacteria bacterium]|nr:HAD family hydrolase [Candidatus Peregrinibacteria bacterium]